MKQLVSVVLPTFRRADYLSKSFATVASQTYRPLELIVVDDNGRGTEQQVRTEGAVRAFEKTKADSSLELIYLVMEENGGAAAARNFGARNARGMHLSFLDDDDDWYPRRIEELLALIEKNSDLSMVYSAVEIRGARGVVVNYYRPKPSEGIERRLLARNEIGTTSCALIRADSFEQVGGFDERFPSRQDLDLWLRLARVGKFRASDEALTVHNKHDDRITGRFSVKNEGRLRFLEKYRDELERNPAAFARFAEEAARSCVKHKKWREARGWYRLSLAKKPNFRVMLKLIRAVFFSMFRPVNKEDKS